MRISSTVAALSLLLASAVCAADSAPIPRSTPRIHNSACELADAMASRLGSTQVTQEAARQSCQALAPTMSATDHAEFMRCCINRLTGAGTHGKQDPSKKQPPPNGGQRM